MQDGTLNHNGQSARSEVMRSALAIAGESPSPKLRSLVCPYCGTITPDSGRCSACSGRFDPLSRQATQNQMGPWSIRDDRLPYRPGCTYETIARLVDQRKISAETILRGPSTRQFWTLARHTPGVAHLLGICHSCQTQVSAGGFACPVCHASFTTERDRQHLGLGPSRPLPGQGLPEVLALHAEPASQPGIGGAESQDNVVSTPIGTRASPANTEIQATGSSTLIKQFEDASRLARSWKKAWEIQRRRAWVVIILSLLITVVALTYAILGVYSMR
jgi:RNA polymerase subunit RPABC4/transcription elongation factor Spt4